MKGNLFNYTFQEIIHQAKQIAKTTDLPTTKLWPCYYYNSLTETQYKGVILSDSLPHINGAKIVDSEDEIDDREYFSTIILNDPMEVKIVVPGLIYYNPKDDELFTVAREPGNHEQAYQYVSLEQDLFMYPYGPNIKTTKVKDILEFIEARLELAKYECGFAVAPSSLDPRLGSLIPVAQSLAQFTGIWEMPMYFVHEVPRHVREHYEAIASKFGWGKKPSRNQAIVLLALLAFLSSKH